MVDRVKPLKWETDDDGTENDQFQTPTNPAEDHLEAAGLVIQRYVGPGEGDHTDDEAVHIYRDSSDPDKMLFKDEENTSPVSLSDLVARLTSAAHRTVDQLVHALDESYYEEYTYSGWKPTSVIVWTSVAKTLKIREYTYTWSGSSITQEVIKQYDGAGSLVETLTLVYAYTNGQLSSVTCTRS